MSDKDPPQDTVEAMHDGVPETKWEHIPVNPVDRLFTWGSRVVLPTWCQSPEHWTSKVVEYLWVDCPCCLFYRGVTVGVVAGLCSSILIIVTIGILLR